MMGVWSPSLGSQDQGLGSVARLQSTLPLMVTSARGPRGSSPAGVRSATAVRARSIVVKIPVHRCRGMSYLFRPYAGVILVADRFGSAILARSTTRCYPTDPSERLHRRAVG